MDMMKCLKYIEENLECTLAVRVLAEYMGYSEYHFSREFSHQLGISVMDYVVRRKLIKAAEMLIDGQKVLDVAIQFGWQSHGGFTKAFKREYGFSPSFLKMMLLQMSDLGGWIFMKRIENYVTKENLFELLKNTMGRTAEEELHTFYQIALEAYDGMKRYSGEEFVTHPLNVALILAQMEVEKEIIYAGLFYDVFFEQQEKWESVAEKLPKEVLDIINTAVAFDVQSGKISEDNEAAVMVKLADRLHNMRTIEFLTEEKRAKKAKETIELFMPVARRLGNAKLCEELNDLALKYL